MGRWVEFDHLGLPGLGEMAWSIPLPSVPMQCSACAHSSASCFLSRRSSSLLAYTVTRATQVDTTRKSWRVRSWAECSRPPGGPSLEGSRGGPPLRSICATQQVEIPLRFSFLPDGKATRVIWERGLEVGECECRCCWCGCPDRERRFGTTETRRSATPTCTF